MVYYATPKNHNECEHQLFKFKRKIPPEKVSFVLHPNMGSFFAAIYSCIIRKISMFIRQLRCNEKGSRCSFNLMLRIESSTCALFASENFQCHIKINHKMHLNRTKSINCTNFYRFYGR